MANYNQSSQVIEMLKPIINNCIENHPLVKSAIKAKKAIVVMVNTANKTAEIRFPMDATTITLPYNPQMESYIAKDKVVSVWYYGKNVNNGIIMQDGAWSI